MWRTKEVKYVAKTMVYIDFGICLVEMSIIKYNMEKEDEGLRLCVKC